METSDDTRPEHLCETLDGEGQQDNLDVQDMMLPVDDAELPAETGENESLDFIDSDYVKFKLIQTKDIDTIKNEACQLSDEQRIIFDKIVKLDEIIAEKNICVILVKSVFFSFQR